MADRTVAYVIDDLGFGGAQKQLSLLARHLPAPYRPTVISLSEIVDPFGPMLKAAGVPVTALVRRSGVDIGRAWQLKKRLDALNASLVHGFLDAANVYAFVAGRLQQIPVVLSLRNENIRLGGARGQTLSWMLRHADAVLVNSRAGSEFLTGTVGVAPHRVVYAANWIDPEFLAAAKARPNRATTHTFGCVARFHPQKQLHVLVEALPRVRERLPDATLLMQGEGPELESLRALARKLDVDKFVEFVPAGADVDGTLARLDCFALPSSYEGLPNAAIEALAMGVPLVASHTGDVSDLIEPGRTGVLITGNAAPAIADAIASCLSNLALADAARIAGPELIERRYSMHTGLSTLTRLYNSLT